MARQSEQPPPGFENDEPITGWKLIAQNPSVVAMIETLLDLPPRREFNQKEFSELAGVSRKSVHTHLGVLEDLGIVEEVPQTAPTRYRFNPESEVSKALIRLDGAVNNAGPPGE